jgi:hypothetical protein
MAEFMKAFGGGEFRLIFRTFSGILMFIAQMLSYCPGFASDSFLYI